MFFSAITKNLTWEIFTKKNHYYGGSLKNLSFREGGQEKSIYRGELPEKGRGLGQFADLRGVLRAGWCY